VGWGLFAFLSYKAANAKFDNKIYDPFEILGIRAVSVFLVLPLIRRASPCVQKFRDFRELWGMVIVCTRSVQS